jgi:ABC-type sugar transport system ATPase subunit
MLYNQPANTFVAGFIGSPRMNFIPIASWPEPTAMTASTAAATAAFTDEPTQAPTPAWPPGTHTVGVRPEHWERASTQAAWALTVQSVEYLGGQQLVQGHLPCQTRIEVLWEGAPPVQVGDALSLQVKPGQAHTFDAQGQRLGGKRP